MIENTKKELDLLLNKCEDEEERKMQKQINDNVLAIVEKFCEMEHSGYTAEYEINLIIKTLRQQPLSKSTLNDKAKMLNAMADFLIAELDFIGKNHNELEKLQQENQQLKEVIDNILKIDLFENECPLSYFDDDNWKKLYDCGNCKDNYKECWLKCFKSKEW